MAERFSMAPMTPAGAIHAAGQSADAAERARSQEQRLQGAEQRAQSGERRTQEQFAFGMGQARAKSAEEDMYRQARMKMHESAVKFAQGKNYSQLANDVLNLIKTGGGQMAAPLFNVLLQYGGKKPSAEASNLIPGPHDKDGRAGYYAVDLENNRVKVDGQDAWIPYQVEVQKPITVQQDGRVIQLVDQGPGMPKVWQEVDLGGARSTPGKTVGTIPQGYELVQGAGGQKSMKPIPGGPAARKIGEVAEKEKRAGQMTVERSKLVVRDIDKAIQRIETAVIPATGVLSYATEWIPGTNSWQLPFDLESVVANIGLAELQAMRRASPTGGALGQVSDRENAILQAVKGSMKTRQQGPVMLENLRQLKDLYLDAWFGTDGERQQAVSDGSMTQEESADLARQREIVRAKGFDMLGRPLSPETDVRPPEAKPGSAQPNQRDVLIQDGQMFDARTMEHIGPAQ